MDLLDRYSPFDTRDIRNVINVSIAAHVVAFFVMWRMDAAASVDSPAFTDVDYYVFSDAAEHVMKMQSPYERHTYRYTPLLAWLLVPNGIMAWWGKILFCAADVYASWLIYQMLVDRNLNPQRAARLTMLWAWNPLVMYSFFGFVLFFAGLPLPQGRSALD